MSSPWFVKLFMSLVSFQIRKKAGRLKIRYSFLFVRANGDQLKKISSLIDSGIIRPIMDKIFPFEATSEAMAYVETGRAKGKVVVNMR
jgi:alcohol dehydrogenase